MDFSFSGNKSHEFIFWELAGCVANSCAASVIQRYSFLSDSGKAFEKLKPVLPDLTIRIRIVTNLLFD